MKPQFTGKERDETNLDFFGARYFSGAQGRFTSADQPLIDQDPFSPQSWNLYSYTRNNPLARVDVDGRSCVDLAGGIKGDDGDGKGCPDAGVKPSTPEQRERAEDIEPQQVDVQDKRGSILAFLLAPPVPRYVENDVPLSENAQKVLALAYERTTHDLGCIGLGAVVTGGSMAASAPIIPKPFSAGGTPNTSVVSTLLGGINIGTRVRTPVGMPGTSSFAWRRSADLGRITGRYLPYAGTAVGAYVTYRCLGSKP